MTRRAPPEQATAGRAPLPSPATGHTPIDILAALRRPSLFGKHFQGPSWAAWRAFLAALFALPMSAGQFETFKACTGRSTAPTQPFREATLICGRRAGKSRVLALVATFLATLRDYAPHLAAGEIATIAVIAADRRQARVIMRYVIGLLRDTPALAELIVGETAESITLSNRVQIEITTASFRLSRGFTFAAVLADEVAFWPKDDSAEPDTEIIRAVRPGLSSIPGAMLLLASSPYAKSGLLWEAFSRNYGRDDARVLVWRAATAIMNPSIDAEIIADAMEADPAGAAAEYMAEFRSDVSQFLDRQMVEGAVDRGVLVRPPVPGLNYVAFADPSGGSADAFTLAIAHAEGAAVILDALLERRPPFDPGAVVAEIAGLLREYGLATATGDRYAAQWVVGAFQQHGIAYQHSVHDRSAVYMNTLPLFTAGRVQLLDSPRLVAQFAGLERRTSSGGRDRVDHAPGAHDDLANAAAGALAMVGTLQRVVPIGRIEVFSLRAPAPHLASGPEYSLGIFG